MSFEYYDISFYENNYSGQFKENAKKKFPFQDSKLFEGSLTQVKLLTDNIDPTIPHVYEIKIILPEACPRTYQAGDTIGILPKNDENEVGEIFNHLDLNDKANKIVQIKGLKIPEHIPAEGHTLMEIFLNNLDIRSIPSKLFLKSLIAQCDDQTEIERLSEICKPGNSEKYSEFVNSDGKTFLTLLKSFPKCQPTLSTLIKYLPALKPRPYSISSAFSSQSVNITFSVRNGIEKGVCSAYLEKHCKNLTNDLPYLIQFYFRLPTDFRLLDESVILIATGTGIAPFLGFLAERASAQSSGGVYLYYGCRYKQQDFLYRAALEKYHEERVLTELHTSFSRDGAKKVYIQERIKETWNKLYYLMNCEGAVVYVCGDGKTMMADVRRTFVELLKISADLSDDKQAENMLKTMKHNRKYVEDNWG